MSKSKIKSRKKKIESTGPASWWKRFKIWWRRQKKHVFSVISVFLALLFWFFPRNTTIEVQIPPIEKPNMSSNNETDSNPAYGDSLLIVRGSLNDTSTKSLILSASNDEFTPAPDESSVIVVREDSIESSNRTYPINIISGSDERGIEIYVDNEDFPRTTLSGNVTTIKLTEGRHYLRMINELSQKYLNTTVDVPDQKRLPIDISLFKDRKNEE